MPSVKDILIEMKDMSELMVDLAYSAVLFNNKAAAEEVLTLENRLNSMNYEIKKQSLVAARSLEDAEKLTTLLEIAEAAEIKMKYKGYIDRERIVADKMHRLENIKIKGHFNYNELQGLSTECRQKLEKNPKGTSFV